MKKRILTREQKDAHNRRNKYRRNKLITEGFCRECATPNSNGKSNCDDCRQKQSDRLNKRHRRNPAHSLWFNARSRAREKNLPFTITVDDIIVPDICPALGIPLVVGDEKLHDSSPTLDQIFPGMGYTPENIIVISHRANTIKRDASADEVEKVLVYMQRTMV